MDSSNWVDCVGVPPPPPPATASMSLQRLRLRTSRVASEGAAAALHFFWSGLFTGVNDVHGGGRHVVTHSAFTKAAAGEGVFFRGATEGVGAVTLAGVATGLAPNFPKGSKRYYPKNNCFNIFYNNNLNELLEVITNYKNFKTQPGTSFRLSLPSRAASSSDAEKDSIDDAALDRS